MKADGTAFAAESLSWLDAGLRDADLHHPLLAQLHERPSLSQAEFADLLGYFAKYSNHEDLRQLGASAWEHSPLHQQRQIIPLLLDQVLDQVPDQVSHQGGAAGSAMVRLFGQDGLLARHYPFEFETEAIDSEQFRVSVTCPVDFVLREILFEVLTGMIDEGARLIFCQPIVAVEATSEEEKAEAAESNRLKVLITARSGVRKKPRFVSPSSARNIRQGMLDEYDQLLQQYATLAGQLAEAEKETDASASDLNDEQGDHQAHQARLDAVNAIREQLIAVQRTSLAGEMTRGIVHDFKNLLLSLDALIDQQQTAPDPAFLKALAELTRYGTELTGELMSFVANDSTSAEMTTLDLSEVLLAQSRLLRWLLPASIKLTTRLAENLRVAGSTLHLRQILTNLVLNARDAMPEGGEVIVSTLADGGEAVLKVSDTGQGIAPDIRSRIFEPLFTTKPGGADAGSGVGLSLTRELVHQHGGSISFETRTSFESRTWSETHTTAVEPNATPQTGTTFIVRLPRQDDA